MAGLLGEPRVVKAGNRGPFTLDGTRSFLVGQESVAVIDPGPNVGDHVRALRVALAETAEIKILLTHRHSDHSGAAAELSSALGAPVFGPQAPDDPPLQDGQRFFTDEGDLVAISTPGHTRDHVGFWWSRESALFAGDLFLGRGSTTWLGEYPGCVADYLASLRRVQELKPRVIYPAHGPPLRSPGKTVENFRAHRMERLEQVREVRDSMPQASPDEILHRIYGGEIPDRLVKAARSSVEVMLFHLEEAP